MTLRQHFDHPRGTSYHQCQVCGCWVGLMQTHVCAGGKPTWAGWYPPPVPSRRLP